MTIRVAILVAAAAGCRVPPASPDACEPTGQSRTALLARRVAADTAAEVAAHPGPAARGIAAELPAHLRAWAAGAVGKRVAMRLIPPGPVRGDGPTFDPADGPACPADLCLYVDGNDALAVLDRVIDGATGRLDVTSFLWGNDPYGWHIARKLAARAGPDLPVRVLVGGGNLPQGEPRDAPADHVEAVVCWLARQPHVHLIRTRNAFLRFDHRKLVVADGRVAWGGGRNFTEKAFAGDHDLTYTVTGSTAGRLAAAFEESWRYQGGPPADPLPAGPPQGAVTAAARVVRTEPTERSLARAVYDAIDGAGSRVYLQTPYLGDGRTVALLGRARRRGADVRVVLTLDTRSRLYDRANRVTANRLLAAGVRVYLYPGMTHVKAAAVDGAWGYVGSANFDSLSLRHNREVGLAITGPAVGDLEREIFQADFATVPELTEPLDISLTDWLAELAAAAAG